jgi:hypothetical protein
LRLFLILGECVTIRLLLVFGQTKEIAMAVKAIAVELHGDGSRGSVTIESDLREFPMQIEELTSSKAREHVLSEAVKKGIKGLPGISRTVDPPYPVNADGQAIENLQDEDGNPLPPQHSRAQPVAYRARYEVTARQ